MSASQTFGTRSTDPRYVEEDASATVKLVQTYLSQFEPTVEGDPKHGWWTLRLPFPDSAEYQFSLHGELGGERQISSRLTQSKGSRSRFWYSAMELADFHNDSSKLEALFHQQVGAVLQYPTRIVEKKGVLWLSYRAEYQVNADWQRLRGGVTYLGLGFGIPFIGRKRVYTSPPLVSCVQR